jgi:hypothetical protein
VTVASTVSSGIVEIRDASRSEQIREPERVADRHAAHVEIDVLGISIGSALDVDLALHLRKHTALLGARRLTHELHRATRLDRLVEPYLVQIDVGDVAADRILLVVLEDRRVRSRLSFEDDVEDRVQAAGAGEDAS